MKKSVISLLVLLFFFLTCCSSVRNIDEVYEFGYESEYDIEKEDIELLAEFLEVSGDLYGSYRLFDTIGVNTKELDNIYHFKEGRNQWSKLKSGLDVFINYSDCPDVYLVFLRNHYENVSLSSIPVGSKGPAGGYVFYDKGYYSDGWRYLEAAPKDLKDKYEWGTFIQTSTEIGTGKTNTETISSLSKKNAAKACLDYSINGYDDWFLPSMKELYLMYSVLAANGLGGFAKDYYWSSSTDKSGDGNDAWWQDFGNGAQGSYYPHTTNYYVSSFISAVSNGVLGSNNKSNRDCNLRVRAVRAF